MDEWWLAGFILLLICLFLLLDCFQFSHMGLDLLAPLFSELGFGCL